MLQSLKRKKKKRVMGAYLHKYILNNDLFMLECAPNAYKIRFFPPQFHSLIWNYTCLRNVLNIIMVQNLSLIVKHELIKGIQDKDFFEQLIFEYFLADGCGVSLKIS